MRKLCFPEGEGKMQVLHFHPQMGRERHGQVGTTPTRSLMLVVYVKNILLNQKTQIQKPLKY